MIPRGANRNQSVRSLLDLPRHEFAESGFIHFSVLHGGNQRGERTSNLHNKLLGNKLETIDSLRLKRVLPEYGGTIDVHFYTGKQL